jgi:hypothetical protein
MKNIVIGLLLVLFTGASCGRSYNPSDDKKAIAEFEELYNKNSKSGNKAANADLFTDDGIRIEGNKIYSGKEAIRELFRKQDEVRTILKQEMKGIKIWSSKDFITVTGTRVITFLDKSSQDTVVLESAIVALYERLPDGSLMLAYNLKNDLK